MTLKLAKVDGKYIVSGFLDEKQKNRLVKTGFKNKVFKVFNTKAKALSFIKSKKAKKENN